MICLIMQKASLFSSLLAPELAGTNILIRVFHGDLESGTGSNRRLLSAPCRASEEGEEEDSSYAFDMMA